MNTSSLYQRVLGPEFARLAPALRNFHSLAGRHVLHGWVETDAPASAAARVLAWCLGAPQRAHSGPLRFELDAGPASEVWTRHFPGKTMRSRLSAGASRVVEQMGPARLTFDLVRSDAVLHMQLVGLQFLRVPCPRWLLPRILAQESGDSGRLHFRVQASVPVLGHVASYRGYLDVPAGENPA
jgi:hypothetical protein